jgi:hypothetical protein
MTTTAIKTAMIQGQQRQRGDGGGGDGRDGIIIPRPCPPLHPMQDGHRLLASSLFDSHLRHLHPPMVASFFSSFSL